MSKAESLFYKLLNIKTSITISFSVLLGFMVTNVQEGNLELAISIIWPYLVFLMICFLLFPLFNVLHRWVYGKLGVPYPGLNIE